MTQEQTILPHLGQIYRDIRKAKGITINSLEDKLISKSMISKFERGISDLSITRFLHLLDGIDMRADEFFAYRLNAETADIEKLIRQFYDGFFAKDTQALKNLVQQCRELGQTSQNPTYSYLETMVWNGLSGLGETDLPKDFEEKKQATFDYLFTCEKWFRLEFHLFGNMADSLTLDSLVLFARPIAQNIEIYLASPSEAMAESILTTVLYLACLEGRTDLAHEFASILETISIDERNITSKIFFKFYLGCYYRYIQQNEEDGKQMMETAKWILRELDCPGRLHFLLQHEAALKNYYKTS